MAINKLSNASLIKFSKSMLCILDYIFYKNYLIKSIIKILYEVIKVWSIFYRV